MTKLKSPPDVNARIARPSIRACQTSSGVTLDATASMTLQLNELFSALPDGNAQEQTTSTNTSAVLFLGDGDFSFAAAHAELYPDDRLHVTEVLSRETWQATYRNTTRRLASLERAGNTIGDGTQEGHAVLEECGKDGAADVVGVCLWWDHTCWRMQWCGTWSQMGIVAITGA